ncbi:hypothetical protein D3C78_858360 [compost metagenome]
MALGSSTSLANSLMPIRPKTSRKMLASARLPTVNQKMCGLSTISIGPGLRPWITSAPMITAVTASPGMPRVSIGT